MTNPNGRFGIHGGQYIPETLMNAVKELEEAYNYYKNDPEFNRELTELLNDYAGRPSRLYYAEKMTKDLGGAKIYLKREDLNHTGAHKINNVLGQALLAKKMGKTRLIAETGAGQHGVATATAAALMGMECVVFMGEEDTKRQALNVYRMRLLGAEVIPVTSGTATLKDAVSEAMREWTKRISKGRSGSYSINHQQSGRDLMTPDEVRLLDNSKCILFIRGERPVVDYKYNLLKHPNIRCTEDGGAAPYDYTAADNARDDLPGAPENYELLDMDDFLPGEPAEIRPAIQRIRRPK